MYTIHINIANDCLTPCQGQEFFKTKLLPAYVNADIVIINLDHIINYSALFFKEAFGSLVYEYGLAAVQQKIRFYSIDKSYLISKIQQWILECSTSQKNIKTTSFRPQVLSSDEVRKLLHEGREARREVDIRLERMDRIDD
jgi:hypothetical protein